MISKTNRYHRGYWTDSIANDIRYHTKGYDFSIQKKVSSVTKYLELVPEPIKIYFNSNYVRFEFANKFYISVYSEKIIVPLCDPNTSHYTDDSVYISWIEKEYLKFNGDMVSIEDERQWNLGNRDHFKKY